MYHVFLFMCYVSADVYRVHFAISDPAVYQVFVKRFTFDEWPESQWRGELYHIKVTKTLQERFKRFKEYQNLLKTLMIRQ